MANDSDFATLPIVDVNLFLSGSLESEEVVQECKKVGNMQQKYYVPQHVCKLAVSDCSPHLPCNHTISPSVYGLDHLGCRCTDQVWCPACTRRTRFRGRQHYLPRFARGLLRPAPSRSQARRASRAFVPDRCHPREYRETEMRRRRALSGCYCAFGPSGEAARYNGAQS